MNIDQWQIRWCLPYQAMVELSDAIQPEIAPKPVGASDMTESAVEQRVRLKASQAGIRLFRNNVGACQDVNGRPVRYGLANDSSRINKAVKSGDLIGVTPVMIRSKHLGMLFGVFTSIECKKSAWEYKGKGREVAQNNWNTVINSLGGFARFANSESVIDEIRSFQE